MTSRDQESGLLESEAILLPRFDGKQVDRRMDSALEKTAIQMDCNKVTMTRKKTVARNRKGESREVHFDDWRLSRTQKERQSTRRTRYTLTKRVAWRTRTTRKSREEVRTGTQDDMYYERDPRASSENHGIRRQIYPTRPHHASSVPVRL